MSQHTDISEPRSTRSDGQRSRTAILDAAAALATVDGLEGLSIGDLAGRTGMSKSGLYAHFKSKEELQIAIVDHAAVIFAAEVVRPGHASGEGLALLRGLADTFLDHLERRVFPGGCFFASVGAEFDSRPGRVKQRVLEFINTWMAELVAAAAQAQARGEITSEIDAEQVAWEVDALLLMAHASFVMTAEPTALERSRIGLKRLLDGIAVS